MHVLMTGAHGAGGSEDGLSRTESVDDAVASLFPDAQIFLAGNPVPDSGSCVTAPASGSDIMAYAPAVLHAHQMPGVAAVAGRALGSGMHAPSTAAGSAFLVAQYSSGGAHFPLDASANTGSSNSSALNPLSLSFEATMSAHYTRPDSLLAAGGNPMALPHGSLSRTSSGYSAVLSGESQMQGMPLGPSAAGLALPSSSTPVSSVFVRTASGGFSRAPSSGYLSQHSTCAATASRTSSTGGSISGISLESVSPRGDGLERTSSGASAGEKRGKGNAPKRRPWSAEEHSRFLESLKRFGQKDKPENNGKVTVGLGPGVAELISVVVGTRTVSQVRSHAQKYFLQLSRTASASSAAPSSALSSQNASTSQITPTGVGTNVGVAQAGPFVSTQVKREEANTNKVASASGIGAPELGAARSGGNATGGEVDNKNDDKKRSLEAALENAVSEVKRRLPQQVKDDAKMSLLVKDEPQPWQPI